MKRFNNKLTMNLAKAQQDLKFNSDTNLPIKYTSMIDSFSLFVMQCMMKLLLPKEATKILHSCGNDGYKAL